ncbi:MAG TPA: hypothetical protein VHN99_05830 [Deinococcales bacterium]|nr:hypothetical protein [Deinococcales bacterium]
MPRLLPLLTAALAAGLAFAANATFSIREAPRQDVDLDTGAISLPKGGLIEDSLTGLTVRAGSATIVQGQSLLARDATVISKTNGTIHATGLDYQVKTGRVTATGPLEYSFETFKGLKASKALISIPDGIAVVKGGVSAASPALNADAAVVDTKARVAFLYGHFRFDKLTSNKADGQLLLRFPEGSGKVSASTTIPAADRARFLKWLGE